MDLVASKSSSEWPNNVSDMEYAQIWGYPVLTFLIFSVILYILPEYRFTSDPKPDVENSGEKSQLLGEKKQNKPKETVMISGEAAVKGKQYKDAWTDTFDLWFFIFMMVVLAVLALATTFYQPELWSNSTFWVYQLPKPLVMMFVSVLMGLVCRHYMPVDEDGYIMPIDTSGMTKEQRKKRFKVNYTRKVQHFCAYFVPLVVQTPSSCDCDGVIETAWGQWMTLMCFMIMIKPLREAPYIGKFFMLQFNSMDRPEDRPHTLKWIVAFNIIPGTIMINFFRWLYTPMGVEQLALIFVFVTGLGDGLAEPVGIWFGDHEYKVRSCTSNIKYVRSYEGSVCVWLSGMIFTAMEYDYFPSAEAFWVCYWLMGPCMAIAEATSPHTMDTPFLMGFGGLIIYLCCLYFP